MRVKRRALLERTAHSPWALRLSGFSNTVASQISNPSSPRASHCAICSSARRRRNVSICLAFHPWWWIKVLSRFVPPPWPSPSMYPPNSLSNNPWVRSRNDTMASTVCTRVRSGLLSTVTSHSRTNGSRKRRKFIPYLCESSPGSHSFLDGDRSSCARKGTMAYFSNINIPPLGP